MSKSRIIQSKKVVDKINIETFVLERLINIETFVLERVKTVIENIDQGKTLSDNLQEEFYLLYGRGIHDICGQFDLKFLKYGDRRIIVDLKTRLVYFTNYPQYTFYPDGVLPDLIFTKDILKGFALELAPGPTNKTIHSVEKNSKKRSASVVDENVKEGVRVYKKQRREELFSQSVQNQQTYQQDYQYHYYQPQFFESSSSQVTTANHQMISNDFNNANNNYVTESSLLGSNATSTTTQPTSTQQQGETHYLYALSSSVNTNKPTADSIKLFNQQIEATYKRREACPENSFEACYQILYNKTIQQACKEIGLEFLKYKPKNRTFWLIIDPTTNLLYFSNYHTRKSFLEGKPVTELPENSLLMKIKSAQALNQTTTTKEIPSKKPTVVFDNKPNTFITPASLLGLPEQPPSILKTQLPSVVTPEFNPPDKNHEFARSYSIFSPPVKPKTTEATMILQEKLITQVSEIYEVPGDNFKIKFNQCSCNISYDEFMKKLEGQGLKLEEFSDSLAILDEDNTMIKILVDQHKNKNYLINPY